MKSDVFISYSSKDIAVANDVKSILEANGIKCWMAPESIPASSSYMEEIPDGIENSAVFLLLLSEQAQESKWVTKEMGNAITAGKIIIPFMISNCEITKAFKFSLGDIQRWEAYEDLSGNLEKLVRQIKGIVGIELEESANSVEKATVTSGAVKAQAWKDIFDYKVFDGAISITGIKDEEVKEVVIPDEIDGLSVREIGVAAFMECKNLTDIKLPDSVTEIGASAFVFCFNLKNINIPHGVTKINTTTFWMCFHLTDIKIPDSVTEIGVRAFSGCSNLEDIKIPPSVTKIGAFAFSDCKKLKNVTMPDGVYIGLGAFSNTAWLRKQLWKSPWVIKNGCLHATRKKSGFVTIPDGVKVIGNAFKDSVKLKSVAIPDGVTEIGDLAFEGCSSLKDINIPDSVTVIGDKAFANCSNLTDIHIPNSVTVIGHEAFEGCKQLAIHCKRGSSAHKVAAARGYHYELE